MPRASSYQLTSQIVADHAGEAVICLSAAGIGRRFVLHAERPGPSLNSRVDLPSGAAHSIAPVETSTPLIMVRIQGALEQRAGYYDECAGWSDGHDAVCERLCAAFEEGDVLLVIDSPGGAAAGIEQNTTRALAAKVALGRRVTVYADEMIGSAATWWAMALGDEIYGPPHAQFGSIGARAKHQSIAGMLAKEGVVVTDFSDPPEKVALSPDHPLDAVGAARGNRDVSLCADAFRAACCAGPLGIRAGLTPEYLVQLGADMLTGEAAVAAGLADGIDTLENVIAYALTLAESETVSAPTNGATGAVNQGDRAMPNVRAEGDNKPDDDKEPEAERGIDIPTKCASCSVENDKDAKFCKGCGESMATMAAEEEPPPSSKPAALARMTAPAKVDPSASLASILGATGTSDLAIKTAAIALRQVRDTVAGVTGKANAGEMVGALLTMPERLASADAAVATERKRAQEAERTTRADLARRLNKLSLAGWPRGNIYTDHVDGAGKRAVSLAPVVASMDLGVLKGMVEGFERAAPKPDAFAPGRERAKEGADANAAAEGVGGDGAPMLTGGEPSKAQVDAAVKLDAVKQIATQSGRDIRAVATQYLKTRAALAGGTVTA